MKTTKLLATLIGLVFAFSANAQQLSMESPQPATAPEIQKAVLFDQSNPPDVVGGIVSVVNNTGAEDDCVATNPSNAIENAFGCSAGNNKTAANDYIVPAGNNATLNSITPIVGMVPGAVVNTVDITIYDDAGGLPGAVIDTQLGVVPTSHTVVGNNFDLDFNEVVMDLTPVFLAGDAGSDTNYWVAISVSSSDGGDAFLEVSTASAIGAPIATSNGSGFVTNATWDGVYTYNAVCSPLDFPAPYCGPLEFSIEVEPMTNVEFAGISNRTDGTVDGTPSHEDFTSLSGDVLAGESYEIALEGYAPDSFPSQFFVFIDWNQNDILEDDGEVYVIQQFISGSDGNDGIEAVQTLVVPSDALPGKTRMRVIKFSGHDPVESCLVGSYGQAEDYSINVTLFPAPYCGPLEFTSAVEPMTNVEFAGISNRTDGTVNGTPAHEDFTSLSGDVLAGESYEIALEGNTFGEYTDRFAVFVDWNQNDVLDDDGEVYEILETIFDSDGNDGQQATQTLEVPEGAVIGQTRMRVKKIYGSTGYLDPCLGTEFGQAEDYSINVTLPPFPAPYCGPLEYNIVEPITNVEFAGFTNRSDAAPDGSPAHEDFTSVVGTVTEGESYEIILEGNTAGDFPNRFAVFIDWDQNGVFETFEVYAIEQTITGSTGEDGQQAIQSIEVPVGVPDGQTRMRVKKIYGTDDYLDPCLGTSYGQAEEYTLDVGTVSNTSFNSTDFTYYPNPVNDILSISTASTVDNIKVYNMLGQMVVETAPKVSNPQVDMNELQSGVYLVTLEVGGSLQTFRVIKQ